MFNSTIPTGPINPQTTDDDAPVPYTLTPAAWRVDDPIPYVLADMDGRGQ